jgi:hypothetical protein
VIVFVTKASSERATSGAVRASRQPEALSSTEHWSFHTETLELAVDLDGTAVAGPVTAGHRRLPGKLCVVDPLAERREHRLGAAGEHVDRILREQLGHVRRLDADLRVRDERGRLGVPVAAEAEDRGRRSELGGQKRQWRDADAPADQQRPPDVEVEAVPERVENGAVAGLERGERTRAGADGSIRWASPRARQTQASVAAPAGA